MYIQGYYFYKRAKISSYSGCYFLKFCEKTINLGCVNKEYLIQVPKGVYVKKHLVDKENSPRSIFMALVEEKPELKASVLAKRKAKKIKKRFSTTKELKKPHKKPFVIKTILRKGVNCGI